MLTEPHTYKCNTFTFHAIYILIQCYLCLLLLLSFSGLYCSVSFSPCPSSQICPSPFNPVSHIRVQKVRSIMSCMFKFTQSGQPYTMCPSLSVFVSHRMQSCLSVQIYQVSPTCLYIPVKQVGYVREIMSIVLHYSNKSYHVYTSNSFT